MTKIEKNPFDDSADRIRLMEIGLRNNDIVTQMAVYARYRRTFGSIAGQIVADDLVAQLLFEKDKSGKPNFERWEEERGRRKLEDETRFNSGR